MSATDKTVCFLLKPLERFFWFCVLPELFFLIDILLILVVKLV